ncbi:peptidylprolyl isomerase [Paracoccus aerodenitrificans]|uniref:peptidylprolyl isomerase n=1 Tax=Paracoccus aerodenitrificans TaxID=3017781 RepID=UPI0022F1251C|nr:peptidylprolyl isomerase [Paracoccus aerodenitrificans]WBU63043.1 SurA N-terminal domain-containing protein [Paracoccus aerodenitrificans]
MSNLRTKGKSTIVWILMGLLLLGLGGFGVTNFTGGTTEIGSVGETEVDAQTYMRVLGNEMNNITRQTGQRMTLEEARAFGLPQSVQAQLFTAAALAEEARKAGVSVGDRTVAEAITSAPAFQGPGGFSRATYSELLRREGLSEQEFESDVRDDQARLILQDAVIGGVRTPEEQVQQSAAWVLEQRDISWIELTAEDLSAPVAVPDEATLQAWHQANADRFTAPEVRKISYLWLTPEMLAETVELDEAALREVYEDRAAEYNQPARRLVGRLVFESTEAAAAAKARIDSGEADFEQIAQERGLSLADTDLGEQSQQQLGAAGEAVFAPEENGVVGPVETDLGPALFSVNAMLDPISVSFEEALPDLRAEAAADRARRLIEEQSSGIEDLLAGGSTLEQVAEETDMQLGQIDWTNENEPVPGEIGGYTAFRQQAASVSENDYPELLELDDGGVFALRLDEIVPPALMPFEEVRDEVAENWAEAEARRQLVALAEQMKLKAVSETIPEITSAANTPQAGGTAGASAAGGSDDPAATILPEWNRETGLFRDGWLENAPPSLVEEAFALEEGETEIMEDGNRVALIRVDRVIPADLESQEAADIMASINERLGMSLQADLFDYYARAIQAQNGLTLNRSAIAAVESQL